MKNKTAVEWLFKHIENVKIIDEYEFIKLQKAFEEAKQMEAEQSKIPELSDEEIEESASAYSAVNSINELELKQKYNDFIYGAKWYREQLIRSILCYSRYNNAEI